MTCSVCDKEVALCTCVRLTSISATGSGTGTYALDTAGRLWRYTPARHDSLGNWRSAYWSRIHGPTVEDVARGEATR